MRPASREKTAGAWPGAGTNPLVSGGLDRNGIVALLASYFLLHIAIRCLISKSDEDTDSIPIGLVDFVKGRYPLLDLSSLDRRFIEAPYHYSGSERMRLGFILTGA